MKIKQILILLVILFSALFIFKNVVLRLVTNNWEKEFLVHETDNFKIRMAENNSKGCIGTDIDFQNDSVFCSNLKLNELLLILTQKNINSSNFLNSEKIPENRFNFYYYPKDSLANFKLHRNEILNCLGREFKFSYNYDTVLQRVYYTKLVNEKKLRQKEIGENVGRFTLGENYIKFHGNTLDGICRAFTFKVKGLKFENNIADSLFYSFTVPSLKKDNVFAYFNDEIGIEFDDREISTEVLFVNFK